MFKDPLTQWDGLFPYDALAVAGITPESSMREILDVSFDLIAKRLMTQEIRKAWDELRLPQRRLVVDFFLYHVDLGAEIARSRETLESELERWAEKPDLSALLSINPEVLKEMEQEFTKIVAEPVDVPLISDFDERPLSLDIVPVEFDS